MRRKRQILILVVTSVTLSWLALGCCEELPKKNVPAADVSDDVSGDATVDATADDGGADDVDDAQGDVPDDTGSGQLDFEDLGVAPFTVRARSDRNVGVIGQVFTLSVEDGASPAEGELSYVWDLDGGSTEDEAEATTLSVRFDAPGQYLVSVTATDDEGEADVSGVHILVFEADRGFVLGDLDADGDLDGDDRALLAAALAREVTLDYSAWTAADVDLDNLLTQKDLDLIDAAILEGASAPRELEPATGSRGAVVRLIHPALLDPSKTAQVAFGEDAPTYLGRGRPGYANTVVPLDRSEEESTEIRLLIDGEEVDRFDFTIEAAPSPRDEDPGALIVGSIEQTTGVLAGAPDLIEELALSLGLTDEEKGALMGMFGESFEVWKTQQAQFLATFMVLPPEGRAIFEEVARANGLDAEMENIERVQAAIDGLALGDVGLSVSAARRVIEILCVLEDIADISDRISRINTIVEGVLGWLDFPGASLIPYYGAIVRALSSISSIIGTVTDVINTALSFLPKIGDSLKVATDPEEVALGESTTVGVTVTLQVAEGLCEGALGQFADALVDRIKELLIRRIGRELPGFESAYRAARYQRDMLDWLYQRVYDGIKFLVDGVISVTGINTLLSDLLSKLCRALLGDETGIDPNLPLAPGEVLESASCGELSGETWDCEDECADENVMFVAEAELCGKTVRGTGEVLCKGCLFTCTEGCCDDQNCVEPADQSGEACGAAGTACQMCGMDQECVDGMCACVSTCTEAEYDMSARRCMDTRAESCQQAEEGCWRWMGTDCADAGATCEDGMCVGGCGPWNCPDDPETMDVEDGPGCCVGSPDDRMCVRGASQSESQCGSNGSACVGCAQGEECRMGMCVCNSPDCRDHCPSGCSAGDPHLITGDGLAYDFQGAGEFVFVESLTMDDPFVVQVRQESLTGGVCGGVSVNTGIATRIGENRISLLEGSALYLNGELVDLDAVGDPGQIMLEGGGVIHRRGATFGISYPDGSYLRVHARGSMDLDLSLADARRGQVQGLLGNFNGERGDDIAPRHQMALPQPIGVDDLYGVYANSYRITDAESLFVYNDGESTDTFQNPGFPGRPQSVDDLDPTARAEAEMLCREGGVLDPYLLNSCILDYACTGDPAYIESLAAVDGGHEELGITTPISFEGWGTESVTANGNWVLDQDGRAVIQTTNGDPTFFISPDDFIDTTITGKITNQDSSDDDYVGFVFGYKSPLASNADDPNDYDMYLFSWKRGEQGSDGFTALEGYTLAHVDGVITDYARNFWGQTDDPPLYDVHATSYGPDRGWEPNVEYAFELVYTRDLIQISIDGEIIFDVTAVSVGGAGFQFEPGRFGFYNFSQAMVRYADFVSR